MTDLMDEFILMPSPKEDASQRPAQRMVEAAQSAEEVRMKNAGLRAQGLRQNAGDEAPRLVLKKVQDEDLAQYEKRLVEHKLKLPKKED